VEKESCSVGNDPPGSVDTSSGNGTTEPSDPAWLRPGFAIAVLIVGAVAGFVAGLLAFGEPWHLQPNWGDVPTWVLAALALSAGIATFIQLNILRRQFAADRAREHKRDELLDRQMEEAQRRVDEDRRRQAEDVEVQLHLNRRRPEFHVIVINRSRRPIFDVSCIVIDAGLRDGRPVRPPLKPYARAIVDLPHLAPDRKVPILSRVDEVRLNALKPNDASAFIFKSKEVPSAYLVSSSFTDDAENRWELDQYQHLTYEGTLDDLRHLYF
jgi:hypothetical protein